MEFGIPSDPVDENVEGGSPRFHMPEFEVIELTGVSGVEAGLADGIVVRTCCLECGSVWELRGPALIGLER